MSDLHFLLKLQQSGSKKIKSDRPIRAKRTGKEIRYTKGCRHVFVKQQMNEYNCFNNRAEKADDYVYRGMY